MLDFLIAIQTLKTTKRTGWVESGIQRPESIADHMHRMSIIAMLIDFPQKDKLVKMAIVHDLAEAVVGDIAPSSKITKVEKYRIEADAIDSFVVMLNHSNEVIEIKQLWEEYEKNETRVAKLCKDIDKFEMILQAFEYESTDLNLESFFESTKGKFTQPEIILLVDELYLKREARLSSRQ